MRARDIKSIDIITKEWFDRTNGNSYFSSIVHIEKRNKEIFEIKLPFQYGYGSHHEDMALRAIKETCGCFKKSKDRLFRLSEKYRFDLNVTKYSNQLKRDVLSFVL